MSETEPATPADERSSEPWDTATWDEPDIAPASRRSRSPKARRPSHTTGPAGSRSSARAVAGGRRRGQSAPRRWRRWLVAGGVVVLLALFAGFHLARAAQAGLSGKRALLAADAAVSGDHVDAARDQLASARRSFREMQDEVGALGPLLPVARMTPFVRIQVRGVEKFADAGALVATAGVQLADAASTLTQPRDGQAAVSSVLDDLRAVKAPLDQGVTALDKAVRNVRALDGYRLVWPLGDAHRDLSKNLERISARATSAQQGLDALIAFAGGGGPRRYLLLSQNPDEVRPTGGFIGTYGVLTTGPGGIRLERYEDITLWTRDHPGAVVPPDQVGPPFRFSTPPREQNLANVNNVPDWPTTARLAVDLWARGGEPPADGVLGITPAFLARILGVVGAVTVPAYNEQVTAANLVERFDFYTRQTTQGTITREDRKAFVAALAEVVVGKLLAAPSSQWSALGRAMGQAFDAREAVAWSKDEAVATALRARRWDGTLPTTSGDFFYDAEFEYAAKNGRGLRRTFDHHVELHPDGSALITTKITVANTEGPRPLNPSSLAYHTIYGPLGATLAASSDRPDSPEPALNGHPAAGWYQAAEPSESVTWTVAWDAPEVARQLTDGTWLYGLWFMHLPDHAGDVVNLRVDLPEGWEWKGTPPPATSKLDTDLVGAWAYGPR